MNYFIVIGVIAYLACTVIGHADNMNMDKKCLVPPPEDVDPMSCCKIPELIDESLVDNCAKKVFGGGAEVPKADNHTGEPPFSPHIRCISECIFNETGILKDRTFQPDVALNLAKKTLGPKQVWIVVVEEAIKTCNDYAIKTNYQDKKVCGHMGAFLVACINTQLFKNCPESSWSDAKGCAALRESTVKCPIIAPIPVQD